MSQLVELQTSAVEWQIDPDLLRQDLHGHASSLFAPDGPKIEEWLQTGQARVVKHGPHRTVYHVTLPGLDFHLKHYRLADTRAWLRTWLRPSKARLEFERTRMALARRVPTLTPLAVGETSAAGRQRSCYLVTRTLPDAVPLTNYMEETLPTLDPSRRARLRQRLAVELGVFLARLHHAGVMYHDLHPGNLLLQLDAIDRPNLYLIDIYDVCFGPPLSWRECRANLIVLNRWFMLRSQRSDRLRCFRAYQAARNRFAQEKGNPPTPWWRRLLASIKCWPQKREMEHSVQDLERGTLRSNLIFWRNLDRRCLGTNRRFRRVRQGDVAGHAVVDLDADLLGHLLDDPDEPFRQAGVRRLKDSPSSTVIELESSGMSGRKLIFKRFAVTTWSDPWVSLLRPTPALRSFVQGHGLDLRCLPTPRPLAVLHRRRHGLRYEGYLLTEKVENACDLVEYVNRLDELPQKEQITHKRQLIVLVGRLICTLHQRRMSHRDLKAPNLLVRTDPETQALSVWFIDLVGVRRHRRLRRSRRIQNLTRLHTSFHDHPAITRSDKLRFLRAYLRWGLRSKLGWKTWWKQIESATEEKIARNLSRGRPLG
jgi:tRNA A-37 threonylcarbamoyl transferase component Bud32